VTAEEHAANLAHLVERYGDIVAKASRARTYYQAGLLDDLEKARHAARDYAAAFGLAVPDMCPQFDFDAIEHKRAEREAKANAPGAAEKRERDRARREEAKERKAAEARRLAVLAATDKLAAWRQGANVLLPYAAREDQNGGALLRVHNGELQTSQGARVPLADAIKVFRFVKLCKERGEAWHRNGRTLPVGAFQVDHVAPNGTFRAGCHLIHWPEIEAAATAAGALDMAPADTRQGEVHA
jgi:hypothetical protein